MSMKRALYSLILYLLFPFVILRLLWKSLSNPAYRQRITERLGLVKIKNNKPVIWIHAVSVGETIAAKPLIEALIEQYPDNQILVTTTTPTGSDQVKSLFSDRVAHVYYPYDLPEIVYRFLNRIKPKLLIVIETEIWPNLFAACSKRKIPIIIANARLSDRSTAAYLKIRGLISETLQHVTTLAVRSQKDADNFKKLGAQTGQIQITGNIKFDIELDKQQVEQGRQRKQQWGITRPVWVAASTHAGEDEEILHIYKSLLNSIEDLLLVLIPRHPERFDQVYELCEELCNELESKRIKTARHTQLSQLNKYDDIKGKKKSIDDINIIVGDSMGEMHSWFAAADVVFIGGSLVNTGGHNPLEAIIQGVPVVSGPYMFNFDDIVTQLQDSSLLTICQTPADIESTIKKLLQADKSSFQEEAKALMQPLRGVTKRLVGLIRQLFP